MKKILNTVCLECGRKYGIKEKKIMGVWIDDCDKCGEKNVPCASAPHDFGIYSTKEIEKTDAIQDCI